MFVPELWADELAKSLKEPSILDTLKTKGKLKTVPGMIVGSLGFPKPSVVKPTPLRIVTNDGRSANIRKFCVFDCETNVVRDRNDDWESRPFIVPKSDTDKTGPIMYGAKDIRIDMSDPKVPKVDMAPTRISAEVEEMQTGVLENDCILVGHNLKFDVQHFPNMLGSKCWDTMIAEYVLTAQQVKFPKLSFLVAKYEPSLSKPDLIGENLEKGIPPQEIDSETLEEYQANDIECTAAVFLKQWELATPPQRALIMVQSGASLAYAEMEMHGLPLDVPEVQKRRDDGELALANLQTEIAAMWGTLAGAETKKIMWDEGLSPRALSAFFYGSPSSFDVKVELSEFEKKKLGKNRKWKTVKIS